MKRRLQAFAASVFRVCKKFPPTHGKTWLQAPDGAVGLHPVKDNKKV